MVEITDKFECPNGNKKCDYRKFINVYENFGRKVTLVPICIARDVRKYSYFAEFPGLGLEKLCRRELYQEIGKTNVEGENYET